MHKDDTPWIVAQQQSHKSESQNSALLYLVVSCVVNLLFGGVCVFSMMKKCHAGGDLGLAVYLPMRILPMNRVAWIPGLWKLKECREFGSIGKLTSYRL